jgi:hypothetical protein
VIHANRNLTRYRSIVFEGRRRNPHRRRKFLEFLDPVMKNAQGADDKERLVMTQAA